MQDDAHPLDQWDEEGAKAQAEFVKKALLDSALLVSVFSTPNGRVLLDRWKDSLIHSPTALPSMDMLTIGINEGQKNFIRSILNAVKLHETSQ